MNEDIVISVKNVDKYFKIYKDKKHSLKERFIYVGKRNQRSERKVLDNISFDVKKRESLALIGKNGSGKSTILKLLSKILRPNNGSIEVKGKLCSLIELGAGFHPDMSGRENIYINASIFNIKKKDVDKKIKQIIEFSELESYIDEPVRTYSSGMYMRLAFSIAINVEADILLIDEILSVGDASFQNKCFNKLEELRNEGVTMIIVSHSMGQIQKLCDRSIWLDNGKVVEDGECSSVINHYLERAGI